MHIHPMTQPVAAEFNDSTLLLDEDFDTLDIRPAQDAPLHVDDEGWDEPAE